ncbi:hypothetical protein FB451DRAFT_1241987 [Mycena latifolia]|nr:hypothetical protein FB451DRAFT_1241987 [Mycena latifolia]
MLAPSPPILRADARLQWDYSAQGLAHWTRSAIDGSISDRLAVEVYFIQNNAVMSLRQFTLSSTNAVPDWIVTDIAFPTTAIPKTLHTLTLPHRVDVLAVVSEAGDVWFLKWDVLAQQPPTWHNLSKPPDLNPNDYSFVDARPCLDGDGQLFIALLTSSKQPMGTPPEIETNIYLISPDDKHRTWKVDQSIDLANFVIQEFIPNSVFGNTSNNSKYGFLVSAADIIDNDEDNPANDTAGIAILTGGTSVLKKTVVAEGSYDSVSFIKLPILNTMPYIFALDSQSRRGACFAQANGEYVKIDLFGNVPLRQIQGALRINSGAKPYTIEIYAVTEGDQILHIASDDFDDTVFHGEQSVALGNSVPIAFNTQSMFLTSSPAGFVAMMNVKKDGTWVKMMQDTDTATWASQAICEPSLENVERQRVYYIEVTLTDSNRTPAVGVGCEIGSTELANIMVNGRAVVVNSVKSYEAFTNAHGKISITIPTDCLAVPTLTLSTNGISARELDIHALLGVEKMFRDITMEQLKSAMNQETKHRLLHASDADLTTLATSLNNLMKVLSPSGPTSSSHERVPSHAAPGEILVLSDIARLRPTTEPSLGYIRGGATADRFRIQFSPLQFEDLAGISSDVGASSSSPFINDSYAVDPPAKRLNVRWGDLFTSIKASVYKVVDVVVAKVQDGVSITLNLLSEGIRYVWDGITHFVRQVFNVVDSLFTSLGCAFEDLFGWLCYLLNWEDIKATAAIFTNYISGFKALGTDWVDIVLPQATSSFFNNCEAKLTEAFDSAKTQLGDEKLGKYDTATPPSNPSSPDPPSPDPQTAFDSLPSTAMWLQGKFLDADDGPTGSIQFTNPISILEGLYVGFHNAIIWLNTPEMRTAANQFMTLLRSFELRNVMDTATFSALLDAVKPVLKELLKNLNGVVDAISKIAKEAFSTIGDLLKAKLWPSGLGAIFKYIFNVDLTVENAICYSLAIPFTILHKILTGVSPADTDDSLTSTKTLGGIAANKKKRSPLVWRAILAVINTVPDITIDLVGLTGALSKLKVKSGMLDLGQIAMKLINCFSLVIGIVDWILMDPAKMIRGTPREKVAISIPAVLHIFTGTWAGFTGFLKGPRGDLVGQIVLFVAGCFSFGTGVWYFFDDNVKSMNIPLGIAGLLRPLSPCGKILRLVAERQPALVLKLGIAITVIDSVSGLGAAGAWYAASLPEAQIIRNLGSQLKALPAPGTNWTESEEYSARAIIRD